MCIRDSRQSLCEKHGIPYNMAVFAFDDLLEAKQWALDTQKAVSYTHLDVYKRQP